MLMKPQKRPLKGKIPHKKVAIAFIELVVKVQNSSTAAAMMTRKESSENASECLVLQDFPQCAIRLQPFNLQ